ncbi:MAG: DNA repair protein RecO [Patescibacteria group bacterium]
MSYLRDRAIVLKSEPFREHDRRVVMYGLSHGLMEAVARGALRHGAKQCGHLLPMTEADVMIAKGAAFDKLAVATCVNSYRGLRNRLGGLAIVGAFFDLFEKLQQPGISDESLYRLLQSLLDVASNLPEDPSIERAKLIYSAAVMKLLDRTGYSPQIQSCGLCRDTFEDEDVRQLPLDGSLAHEDCYRSVRSSQPNAMRLTHGVRSVARFLREESLDRALLITGTSQGFALVSSMILSFLKQAPLMKEPHGVFTISSVLS